MAESAGKRLEYYTIAHPNEVLIVKAQVEGEPDEVTIFKGFSSSLMRQTAYDPDVPVLPEQALIHSIDRFVSPYTPTHPQPIQKGLSWNDFLALLQADGL